MIERIRSFIAVKVPEETAERIRAAQSALREVEPGIKWVSPDSFHITLKFLGGVEPERLKATWASVSEALVGTRPFTMVFRGVGAFPNLNRVRVVWVGTTEGMAELSDLAERAEQACAKHGFEREKRPFAAHLTLGRAREVAPNPRLAAVIEELADLDLGQAGVDRVLLMKSELARQGAVYSELEHALLQ